MSIWKKLGFDICTCPELEQQEGCGLLTTEVHYKLSIFDLFRLIISRKLRIAITQRTECVVRKTGVTACFSVLPPFHPMNTKE